MKLNLSKKKKIIVISILTVVLAGSGGYLLWRVNQDANLGSENSDASKCVAVGTDECDQYAGSCDEARALKGCGSGLGEPDPGKSWCQHYTMQCTSVCGDNTCDSDETASTCPQDCAKCGDGVCSSTESLTSCPGDCSVCGDGKCTGSETASTCPGDCSVCGDGVCTGSETASSCASDCVCKAFTWSNKPSGTYKTTGVPSTVTVKNPNSGSSSTSAISITLNSTTIPSCSVSANGISRTTVGGVCYTLTNTTTTETVAINMLGDSSANPSMEKGTYTLSVSLPGANNISCKESTTFVVGDTTVPQTGLFDGVMNKIYLGSGLVFLGVITTQTPKFSLAFGNIYQKNREVVEIKRKKREEERRSRFEKRFK